jgi:hypothetical protein
MENALRKTPGMASGATDRDESAPAFPAEHCEAGGLESYSVTLLPAWRNA